MRRRQLSWGEMIIRQAANDSAKEEIARELLERGLTHLKVASRGDIVVYSEDEGQKYNRIRFTRIRSDRYELGVGVHTGRWEGTLFEGSLPELLDMALTQFRFMLEED